MPLSVFFVIEAIILSLKYTAPIPRSDDRQCQLVSNFINETGVAATVGRPRYCCPQMWHVTPGETFRETPAQSAALDETHPSRFPIYLFSPVYYETHRAGWKDNIHLVLSAINERTYWRPNPLAGLHVYVRRGLNEKFTLPELKRTAMLVCRFEEAIDTLPPVRRRLSDKDFILSNRFNPALQDLTISEVYSRIQSVADIQELCALLNKREKGANPSELDRGGPHSKYFKVRFAPRNDPMLEFFQYESTVSAESAIKWAEFVFRFVEYAINASETAIVSGGNTVEDLARLIRLP